jgi:hypothetical protein
MFYHSFTFPDVVNGTEPFSYLSPIYQSNAVNTTGESIVVSRDICRIGLSYTIQSRTVNLYVNGVLQQIITIGGGENVQVCATTSTYTVNFYPHTINLGDSVYIEWIDSE